MGGSRESMTAFVTSDVLDHGSLQAFLSAKASGRNVRWRGLCWTIEEHAAPSGPADRHTFRLASAPAEDCV